MWTWSQLTIWILTFPYHLTLHYFTVSPIHRIVCAHQDAAAALKAFVHFVENKREELALVNIGATLSAAATIGVFSWPAIERTTYAAWACWYLSLVLSIFGIITSAQHTAVIRSMRILGTDTVVSTADLDRVLRLVSRRVSSRSDGAKSSLKPEAKTVDSPREQPLEHPIQSAQQSEPTLQSICVDYNMVYIWQSPVMLMAWSWALFLLGLILHIAAPFQYHTGRGSEEAMAISVLIIGGFVVINFGWCSFWMYRAAGGTGDGSIVGNEHV